MRPLELTMEGFTCFRDKTHVDLAALEVFGISGPTGAGKSSILDAITFALFGRVVRVGKQCSSLVSLGRDAMSVNLLFRASGKTYRVARKLRRGAATTAVLEDETGNLASRVRDVDARIEALLGMPFETFTQAVVLPQGQFAKFLASTGAARTEILRNLLGLEIYDRMRRRADERKREAEQRVRVMDDQRVKHFGHASPERLAELEAFVSGDAERIAELSRQADERVAALAQTTRDHERTADLRAAEREVTRLTSKLPELASSRALLDAAAAAEPLRPSIAERDERARALTARLKSHARLDAALGAAAEAERAARDALGRARERGAEIPRLEQRVVELDRILSTAELLRADRAALLAARRALKDAERADKATRDAEAALVAEATTARAEEAALRARVAEGERERGRIEAIEAVVDEARALAELEGIVATLVKQRGDLEQRGAALAAQATRDRAAADEAARSLDEATEAAKIARDEAERARHDAHVDALRDGLEAGAPCPVCERPVDAAPKRPKRPAAKKTTTKKGPDDLATLEKRALEWSSALATRRARVEATDASLNDLKPELERTSRALEDAQPALAERRAHLIEALPAESRAEAPADRAARWVIDTWQALRAARAAGAALRADLERAVGRARELADRLETSRAAASALGGELSAKRARATELERSVKEAEARVAAVTDAEDPAREREDAAATRDALAKALDAQQKAASVADAHLAAAKAVAAESERETSTLRASVERADVALEGASLDAGFASIDELRAALRSPAELEEARRAIDKAEGELRAATARVAELGAALGELRIGDADLGLAREAARASADARDQAIRTHAAREQEVKQLRVDLERATALDADRQRAADERAIFTDLASDLGTANFQQHLQASVVRDLTEQASQRLERLSRSRYRLVVQDEEFWVVDRENANASRPAATLSGGETFLASLALALALSDQIQHAAGAVRLESLFIDEGFGTLDAEALDVAAEAVEALEEGGRMVGIISHLPELNQRLRAELIVERRPSGSSVIIPRFA